MDQWKINTSQYPVGSFTVNSLVIYTHLHTTIPDTQADEDNSDPSKGCREANSREWTNKLASTRTKRKKKFTPDPEYLYY